MALDIQETRGEVVLAVREWIEKARQGDRFAWEEIVRRYSGMALTVAYAKLGDWHRAEDASQEAFAEACRKLGTLHEPGAFPGWFKVIVERQCNRDLRRRRLATVPLDDSLALDADDGDVAQIAERNEWLRRLHRSVDGLSPRLKLAVQLYYFQGYSLKEISASLGVTPAVLKKRLFDARSKIRTSLIVSDPVSVLNELFEGRRKMLHIVNGDSVGNKLKEGNIQGDVLVWREVYPLGPIFRNMSGDEERRARTAYVEHKLGVPADTYLSGCVSQEQTLRDFRKYDEVVLWFEHDLFDQTMLAFLLHWFSSRKLGSTRLNLLCIGDYPGIALFKGLGQLSTQQLIGLAGTWQQIGERELRTGSKIWESYASPDIEEHAALLHEDTSALPFAHEAFAMHMARLPSVGNGLGIVQQLTLDLVRQGILGPLELFKEVGNRLSWLGMGDLEYWHWLDRMAEQPGALIGIEGLAAFPNFERQSPAVLEQCVVSLTELGREVAAGARDWLQAKGTDEWYGGLHLHGNPAWRWDRDRKVIVRS